MAPKRQKVASSSSSTGKIKHSFLNSIAENYFKEFMTRDKALIPEVQFQPSPGDGNILDMLRRRNWLELAVLAGDANVNVVREFYANLKASTSVDSILVRNKVVTFTPEIINAKFGVEHFPVDDYQTMLEEGPDYDLIMREMGHRGANWIYSSVNAAKPLHLITSCLNRYAQAWCRLIRGNLMPTSQKSEFTRERAVLLYCILTERTINVGRLIYNNIVICARGGGTGGHVHPVLITHLCAAANVPMSSADEPWIQQPLYGSSNINNIAQWAFGTARDSGLGFIEGNEQADVPPQPRPQPRVRRSHPDRGTTDQIYRERADERLLRRYEGRTEIPYTRGEASSSSMPPPAPTIDTVLRYLEGISLQQSRLEHRMQDLHSRELDLAVFLSQDIAARNARHGYDAFSDPPFPTFPAHLLQPYAPPRDDVDDDDQSGAV